MIQFALSFSLPLLLSVAFASGARGITLADGLIHTLTSGYLEVVVFDGPGPTTTTVNIEDGAVILQVVRGRDSSVVNIEDGAMLLNAVRGRDSSVLNMNGGVVVGDVTLMESGVLNMSGGAVSSHNGISVSDSSLLNMTGGATENLMLRGNPVASIDGGEIGWLFASDTSVVDLSGDVFLSSMRAHDASVVNVSGGELGSMEARHSSIVTMSGGTLGYNFEARESSNIVIVGNSFEVDGIPVPYGDLTALSGTLTGTLSSGDLINNAFYQGGGAYTGTITLVPEPSTALLLAFGLAGLAAAGRRRSLH